MYLIWSPRLQIRTQLRNEKSGQMSRDVAKLVYIHMLGYPSHFGQVFYTNIPFLFTTKLIIVSQDDIHMTKFPAIVFSSFIQS